MATEHTQCPPRHLWDNYVLNPVMTGAEGLERHLQSCPYCRVLLADREEYYQRLTRLAQDEPARDAGPDFVQLYPSFVTDYDSIPEIRQVAAGPGQMTTPDTWTFLSEDRRWMIKAVRDPESGHHKLFLLSDSGEQVSGRLIRLSGIAESHLTDAEGCVDLGGVKWPQEPSPQVTVVMPAATFTLNAADQLLGMSDATMLQSRSGDTIRIAVESSSTGCRLLLEVVALSAQLAGRPLHIVVSPSLRPVLLPLEPVLVIDDFQVPGQLEILMFP